MSFLKVRNGIEAVFDASILQKRSFRISVKIPGDQRPKRMENARLGRYFRYSIMRIFAVLMFFFFKCFRIECGWKLRHILRGYEGVIKQVHTCTA